MANLQTTTAALPFSKLTKAGGFAFISGQVGFDEANDGLVPGGVEAEARQALRNIGALLAGEGLGFEHLVNVTIYLRSMENYQAVNDIYAGFFTGRFPSRVCVAVAGLPLNAAVEISAMATLT